MARAGNFHPIQHFSSRISCAKCRISTWAKASKVSIQTLPKTKMTFYMDLFRICAHPFRCNTHISPKYVHYIKGLENTTNWGRRPTRWMEGAARAIGVGDLDFNDMVAKSSASAPPLPARRTPPIRQSVQTWKCALGRAIMCYARFTD